MNLLYEKLKLSYPPTNQARRDGQRGLYAQGSEALYCNVDSFYYNVDS